ncbi:actin assembly-inducing protein ActA [Listeria seeligeri]|uniref:actin assembly-inducing protein ActA n=1 Tax=Listeria seeligeri TaxID=1640 RepID=UPI0018883411|nr:actin assembly-inducing protein ActA [Listeria seeligeri]MBF2562690.1 actin assembly-inducing protein ActA [Listeria seeligeri]
MGLKKIPSVILTIVVITSCLSFTTNDMYAQTKDEEDAKSSLNTNEWSEEETKPAAELSDEQGEVKKHDVYESSEKVRDRELKELKELAKNSPAKKGKRDKLKNFFAKRFPSKESDSKTSTKENSVKESQNSESATNKIKESTPKVDKKVAKKAAKATKKAKKKAAELDKQLLGKIAQRRGVLTESSDESGRGYLSTSEEERAKIAKSKNRPMPKEIKSEKKKKKKKDSSAKSIDVEFLPVIQESQLESSDLENEIIEKKTKQPFFSKAFEKIKGAGSWALDKLDKNPGVKKAIVDQSAGFIDQLLTKKSSDESGTVQKEQVKEPAVAQQAPLKPARQAFSSNNPTSKESNSESSVNANIVEYITLIPQNSLGEQHNEMSTKINRVLYAIDSEMPSPPPSSDEEEIAKINRQSSVDSDSSVSSDSSYYFRPSKLPRLQGFASPAHKQNFKSIHKPRIRGNISVLVPSHVNTMKLKPTNNARNYSQPNNLNHAPVVSTNQGSSKGTLQKQTTVTQVRVPLPNSKMSSQKQTNQPSNTIQNNKSAAQVNETTSQVSGTTEVDKSLKVERSQSAPAVLAPPVVLKEDLSKEAAEKKSNLDKQQEEKKVEVVDPVKYSDLNDDSLDEKSEKVLVKSAEDEKAQEISGSNTILIISILAGSVIAVLIFIKILNVRKEN